MVNALSYTTATNNQDQKKNWLLNSFGNMEHEALIWFLFSLCFRISHFADVWKHPVIDKLHQTIVVCSKDGIYIANERTITEGDEESLPKTW